MTQKSIVFLKQRRTTRLMPIAKHRAGLKTVPYINISTQSFETNADGYRLWQNTLTLIAYDG